jgi:RNA polymerase subunit RPABC4/transcription elongation factor Spt4
MSSTNPKELVKMYRSYGLSEPFAMAIVEGKDPKAVMEFWNQDWHKQYPDADDVLVIAVLEQTITPEEGEWLNSVRSNHEDLIQFCLDGSCTIEWAKSLIEAGFVNHSREVSDILKGADPIVIGELSGIELQSDLLPPKLEMKTKNTDFISNNMDYLFSDRRGKREVENDKQNSESSLKDFDKPSHFECSNCRAQVVTGTTSCPYCKFQLVWDWDLLRVPEKSYISTFMRSYLPGISYGRNDLMAFLKLLSSLDHDSITYAEFWDMVKHPTRRDFSAGKQTMPVGGKGRYEVLILFENNGDTALKDVYINDVMPANFEIKDWHIRGTGGDKRTDCEMKTEDGVGGTHISWMVPIVGKGERLDVFMEIKGTGEIDAEALNRFHGVHFRSFGRIPHAMNSLFLDQSGPNSRRNIPSLRGQPFDKDAWIQGMVHASKFWGRV